MDQAKLGKDVNDLVKEFGLEIQGQYQPVKNAGKDKLPQNKDSIQESLDYLRICIKYQLFDLEATKREQNHLRKLLNEIED